VSSAARAAPVSNPADWLPSPNRRRDDHRSQDALARRRHLRSDYEPVRTQPPLPPPPSQPAGPDYGVRTVDGAAWDLGGRYCRWTLPTHSGRPALPSDFDAQKALSGQRYRLMQRDGEGSNAAYQAAKAEFMATRR
jgi:hypothetical protein